VAIRPNANTDKASFFMGSSWGIPQLVGFPKQPFNHCYFSITFSHTAFL